MQQYNGETSEVSIRGDRRKEERRRHSLDRRGTLRWDPQMNERRSGKDRRAGAPRN